MEIENSSLYREITTIINSGGKPVHYHYTAKIHVDNETYLPLKILSCDLLEDYEMNYSDEFVITLAIPGGTYVKRIYPFKDKIDITISRIPIYEVGDSKDENAEIQSERYTATLIDKGNPLVEANGMNTATEDNLNLTNIFDISFQLVNKALEQMRMLTVGGIYRNTIPANVVKTILTNESKKVIVDNARLPIGVDMVDANNTQLRDHVIIPHGTKLISLPEYVHHKCGGIYSAGIGYYFKKDHWYIYPCYDVTRFNKSVRKLTIINVPRNKFPDIERTYRLDGKNLVVMANGEVSLRDETDVQQLNLGNGVRFSDADKYMGNYATTKNNKTTVNRGTNNTEAISSGRQNGNNNVQTSNNPITSNPYLEFSKMSRRQGSILTMVWENSKSELLEPGMMVRMLYLDNDDVKDVYGVLLKSHTYIHPKGTGMMDSRFRSNTAMVFFIQRMLN